MGSPARRAWEVTWLALTAAGALATTVIDAALLQRRRTYFTGGFLSTDHITSWVQAVGFVTGSILNDAAVIGVLVALAMWTLTRLGLGRRAMVMLALMIALSPIAIADFVAYQLLTFLGDAFDFQLMFELAGRNPAELFAVSSGQVTRLVVILVAGLTLLVVAVVVLRRSARRAAPRLETPSLMRALKVPVLLLVAAVVMTTTLQAGSDVLDNGLRRKPTGRLLDAVVSLLTDVDRDGYGLLDHPADPAPFDARIRPWAVDVPGNGIDEDGVGGDLPAGTPPYVEPELPAGDWPSRPSVVMIGLESFRADVVGAVRDGKPVTPVLDALARRGVRSDHAYSHNGYTVQSRRHMFSGSVADVRGPSTLIDDFKSHGYETAYFSGQDESFGGAAGDVGFDRADVSYDARADIARRYSTFTTAGSLALPYNVVVERVVSFLQKRSTSRPLFLYVNFHDTHFPYHHQAIQPLLDSPVLTQFEIRPERREEVSAMYANTAANVDRAIGEVLDAARRSLGAEPAVVVLSDHGESLFDEGFLGHGYALNDAQTKIPLIVANLPAVIEEPFGQADLRVIIQTALAQPSGALQPELRRDDRRRVFQYLGAVDRPAQIALTGARGRVIYDFRTQLAQFRGSDWRRLERLPADQQAVLLELVRLWEQMRLARAAMTVQSASATPTKARATSGSSVFSDELDYPSPEPAALQRFALVSHTSLPRSPEAEESLPGKCLLMMSLQPFTAKTGRFQPNFHGFPQVIATYLAGALAGREFAFLVRRGNTHSYDQD